MGADFIATGLWRRGTVQLTDGEIEVVRNSLRTMPAKTLADNLKPLWEMYEDDPYGMLDLDADREFVPVEEAETIADAIRKTLETDFDWLVDVALKGGDRGVATMQVGPYEVLVMGEMSWGDLSDEQEGLGRIADSGVLESLGFYRQGYGEAGTVLSAIFEVIADRRECKVEDVLAAAKAVDLFEDKHWQYYIGPAVDAVEDDLSDHLPEVPA